MANTEYFCTAANLPGISLSPVEVPYKGVDLSMTGDTLTFDDFSITFNITENMENYIEIYNWMHNIIQAENAEGFKYDARLMILTSHNNVVKEIAFQEIFPSSLSAIEFNAQAGSIDYVQATVTFKYTLFEFS